MDIVVEGTITIDGTESKFQCGNSEYWNQWGATTNRLCESVHIVEAIEKALLEL